MRELDVARLGAQGDGVCETAAGIVHVPFALAGERITAEVEGRRGRLVEVITASPDRRPPACRHFGTCGGCAVQHLATATYRTWKEGLVREAFAQRGIAAEVRPLLDVPQHSRRRAVLSARRARGGAVLGFHAARSDDIVDIAECPVLAPQIFEALPVLRAVASLVVSRRGELRLTVTALSGGLDVAIEGGRADVETRRVLAGQLVKGGIARLALDGEIVAQRTVPSLASGRSNVTPPPGGFVQAAAEAEAAMVRLVLEAITGARKVADLFCGCGTFTMPIAERAQVLAIDGDKDAIMALIKAARAAQGLKPIDARTRDLFRNPLLASELAGLDCVVIDPPRAGAQAQFTEIARSKVERVVAVSCNPATCARDARILLEAGFTLGPVQPIDQFLFSPHVELVTTLTRL
jgi:23S rRNA (uracil1939-C5)-methyltransferase